MRNLLKLVFTLLLLFGFVGCKKAEEDLVGDSLDGLDLETYVETAEIPENFSIAFDPSKVESLGKASVHTAIILEFVEKDRIVIDELVHGEIIDTTNYAEGPWLEAEHNGVREYLIIYDGGASLGMDSGMNGGFTYGIQIDGISLSNKMSLVIENSPGPPGNIAQEFGFDLKSDYGSFVNLDFMDYKDALSEVEDVLYAVGVPEVAVAETYSLDLDTMLEHYNLYLDSRSYFGIDEEDDQYTWSKDDESYSFFFRQVVDDIPLTNTFWPKHEGVPGKSVESSGEIGGTTSSVVYSKDGIISLSAINLLDVEESGEKKPLINPATALKSVIDSYSELLPGQETSVTSMELCYVAILIDEESYQLIPAWIFEITEEDEWDDPHNGTIMLNDYSYFVVNAITGEQIEKASDMK